MHGASSYPGAQFYMECAQLNIVGGSGAKTPSTVSFPGAYKGSDPGERFFLFWRRGGRGRADVHAAGITVNIYYPPLTNYTIPGELPCLGGGRRAVLTSLIDHDRPCSLQLLNEVLC